MADTPRSIEPPSDSGESLAVYAAPIEGELLDAELEQNIERYGVLGGFQQTIWARHMRALDREIFKEQAFLPGASCELDIIDVPE